ncbi:MAG: aspartyl-phosphate phosphatase Spo0E family protein [Bacillaceae bacterium]|nr:aspartyl-phosphate phosphatase Spo0E family protein [Bacillaceae bacterium]
MIKTSTKHGISSHETIKCSQELDKLINLYQQYRQRG